MSKKPDEQVPKNYVTIGIINTRSQVLPHLIEGKTSFHWAGSPSRVNRWQKFALTPDLHGTLEHQHQINLLFLFHFQAQPNVMDSKNSFASILNVLVFMS